MTDAIGYSICVWQSECRPVYCVARLRC